MSHVGTRVTDPPATGSRNRLRQIVTILVLVVLVWLLWPAAHGGRLGLVVVNGTSMQPTYAPGDLVLTWATQVEADRVVLLRVPDGRPAAGDLVIHRIHDRDAGGWITQGDNSAAPDGWRLTERDVLGVAVTRLPGIGVVLRRIVDPLVLGLIIGLALMSWLWPERASAVAGELPAARRDLFDPVDPTRASAATADAGGVHGRSLRRDRRVRARRRRAIRRQERHERRLERRQVIVRLATRSVRHRL